MDMLATVRKQNQIKTVIKEMVLDSFAFKARSSDFYFSQYLPLHFNNLSKLTCINTKSPTNQAEK